MSDVNLKFNKALQCVLLVIVPMTLFLSLLVKPVWTLFYGNSYYGPEVYRMFVFTALFGGMYTIIVNTLQGLSKYKLVIFTVLVGLITNALLDVPLIVFFNSLGMNASYGAVVAALIGYTFSIVIAMYQLKKKYAFSFDDTMKRLPKYIFSWLIFCIVILFLKMLIPTDLTSRFLQIPILILFGGVSFCVYLIINYKNGNLNEVFGNKIDKLMSRFIKK